MSFMGPPPSTSLPVELAHQILDLVQQPTVLVFASVCRAWHAAARTHSSFYMHVPLYRSASAGIYRHPRRRAPSAAHALSALEYARENGIMVSLELNLLRTWSLPGKEVWRDAQLLIRIFLAARATLPRNVQLSVEFPRETYYDVMALLALPAPLMRSMSCVYNEWSDGPLMFPGLDLPEYLFDKHAPALRSVKLRSMVLPSVPLPAFQLAHTVDIAYVHTEKFSPRIQFPRVNALDITVGSQNYDAVALVELDFKGVALQTLKIKFDVPRWRSYLSSRRGRIVTTIPRLQNFDISGFDGANHHILWNSLIAYPCTILIDNDTRAGADSGAYIAKVLTEGCSMSFPFLVDSAFAWTRLMQPRVHVTTLRLAQSVVSTFLTRVAAPVNFPQLQTFIVTVASVPMWPREMDPNCTLHSPILREVQLQRGSRSELWHIPGVARKFLEVSADDLDAIARTLCLSAGSCSVELVAADPSIRIPESHSVFTIAKK